MTSMRAEYKACENEEAGEWKVVKMIKTAGSRGNAGTLRSAKSALDAKRRVLACSAVVDQLIAVESANDAEGFSWWLCLVTQIAFQHEGKTETTENGVKLTAGHWYMKIMYYERSPPIRDQLSLDKTSELIIDNEGVIFVEPIRLTCE